MKLTSERRERLLQALKAGNYRVTAAKYAGISARTLQRWLVRGEEEGRGQYAELAKAVAEAEVFGEVSAVAQVRRAADDNWTAAAWFLERKFPERWGRKDRLTHEGGSDSRPVRVLFGGRYLSGGEAVVGGEATPPPPAEDAAPPDDPDRDTSLDHAD